MGGAFYVRADKVLLSQGASHPKHALLSEDVQKVNEKSMHLAEVELCFCMIRIVFTGLFVVCLLFFNNQYGYIVQQTLTQMQRWLLHGT